MRNLFVLFCGFLGLSVFAQDFHFDLLTKYNSEKNGFKVSSILYSNSDGTCAMKLFSEENKTTAIVYDLNHAVQHYFTVTEDSGEYFFTYVDTDTTAYKMSLSFEIMLKKSKPDKKVLTQKVFRTNKNGKRMEISSSDLTLRPHEKNLYFIYRMSCEENPLGKSGQNTSETGIVEVATSTNSSGTRVSKLEYFKSADVNVSLPSVLTTKKR